MRLPAAAFRPERRAGIHEEVHDGMQAHVRPGGFNRH